MHTIPRTDKRAVKQIYRDYASQMLGHPEPTNWDIPEGREFETGIVFDTIENTYRAQEYIKNRIDGLFIVPEIRGEFNYVTAACAYSSRKDPRRDEFNENYITRLNMQFRHWQNNFEWDATQLTYKSGHTKADDRVELEYCTQDLPNGSNNIVTPLHRAILRSYKDVPQIIRDLRPNKQRIDALMPVRRHPYCGFYFSHDDRGNPVVAKIDLSTDIGIITAPEFLLTNTPIRTMDDFPIIDTRMEIEYELKGIVGLTHCSQEENEELAVRIIREIDSKIREAQLPGMIELDMNKTAHARESKRFYMEEARKQGFDIPPQLPKRVTGIKSGELPRPRSLSNTFLTARLFECLRTIPSPDDIEACRLPAEPVQERAGAYAMYG